MIARTIAVEFAGRTVLCRELTVAEIRAWLLDAGKAQTAADIIADFLFGELRFADLLRVTDVTAAELEAAYPSDIARLVAGAQEANPHFFGFARRLEGLAQTVTNHATAQNA